MTTTSVAPGCLLVIGAGTMGRSIAVAAAVAGVPTTLVDVNERLPGRCSGPDR